MIWQIAYQTQHDCISWHGQCATDGPEFHGFLSERVAARLEDEAGALELHEQLRGLSLTGMGQKALEEVLAADVPETRDWAAGEALAEAVLEAEYAITLPWNMERDKRNPFASLPGADIVGFQREGASHRLALGEVKCSSEGNAPPQIMHGRSGMTNQLEGLATDLRLICQLLKWLAPRIKNTAYKPTFEEACTRYFNSGNRDVALFGVLVRDQAPRERDLRSRGQYLQRHLQAPTHCHLIALYLPWPVAQLVDAIHQRGGS